MSKGPIKVVWSGQATQDLLEIVDYIASDSPINAEKILSRLQGRAESLNTFPKKGRVVPELYNQGISTIREVIVKPWRIIYEFDEERVSIVAVLDSRRSLHAVLMQRFLR